MTIRNEMERQFGRKALERVIKAGVFFDAVDVITEAFQSLRARVETLEAKADIAKATKPVVRVKAGRP